MRDRSTERERIWVNTIRPQRFFPILTELTCIYLSEKEGDIHWKRARHRKTKNERKIDRERKKEIEYFYSRMFFQPLEHILAFIYLEKEGDINRKWEGQRSIEREE